MAEFFAADRRDRIRSAFAAATFHALLFYALVTGLAVDRPPTASDTLKLFDVALPVPPPAAPAPVPAAEPTPEPEGAAAPPNLRADPAPVVAPAPVVLLPVPPPVVAARVVADGNAPSAGAAERPGPGTGAGGEGMGLGSGRFGSGTGGGGGAAVHARLLAGAIVDRDYPAAASRTGAQGTVTVRFTVGIDGRARNCAVMRSSGNADLDSTTCRLIERRFRYAPARDVAGRPVAEERGWQQRWWFEPD